MSARPSAPSRGVTVAVAVACLLVLAYSVVIAGQILLGVLACLLVVGLLLGYRLVVAFFRFVDAVERIAAALERRDGAGGARTPTSLRGGDGGRDRSRSDESRSDGSRTHPDDRW